MTTYSVSIVYTTACSKLSIMYAGEFRGPLVTRALTSTIGSLSPKPRKGALAGNATFVTQTAVLACAMDVCQPQGMEHRK